MTGLWSDDGDVFGEPKHAVWWWGDFGIGWLQI